MVFIVFILIYCILPVVTVNLEQKQFIKRSKVETWGSTSQKEKKNKLKESENLIQKQKEKEKKVWADDERGGETTKREPSTAGRDVEKDRDKDKRQILKSIA